MITEYTSPSNCYSESADIDGLFSEMRLAHAMIASVESVLWAARRPRSQVAILMPRSSGFWDDWETEHPKGVCLCCCVNGATMARYVDCEYTSNLPVACEFWVYSDGCLVMLDTAETYGLYLALATDANIPVGKSQL